MMIYASSLQWRHNGGDAVSNHQPHHCLLNCLFRRRSKKLHVTGLCAGNSSVANEFPAQMASNTENVSIWWRHHVISDQFIISWWFNGQNTYIKPGKWHLSYWQGSVNMMTSSNGTIFLVTGPMCGEFTGPGEFPTQRPVTRSFDVFLHLRLNKQLSKQPWGWWFETPS